MSVKQLYPNLWCYIEPKEKIVTLLWYIFLAIPFILFSVLYVIHNKAGVFFDVENIIQTALLGVAVVQMMMGNVLSKVMLSHSVIGKALSEEGGIVRQQELSGVSRADKEAFEALSDIERKIAMIYGKYFVVKIIRFALAESIAILGFAAGMMQESYYPMLPFIALGLFSHALGRSGFEIYFKQERSLRTFLQ